MKAVVVMFDSLNRHYLPPYAGGQADWVHAPNFKRLAERTATFEKSYVCSMPCMPARRDLHTGRPNFLHTPWQPLEPYDDSVPEILKQNGVYTHLDTDHYHYFEDGGSTYHGRYDSWQLFRGQEGDPFIGQVADPHIPENINGKGRRSDWVNREHIRNDAEYPQTQTFDAGVAFIDRNHAEDQWMLQIECFDPHEPFCTDAMWRDLYPQDEDPVVFDWPSYAEVKETEAQIRKARHNYAALLSKCDHSLGRVLDAFDRHGLWDDTMLIVCTDHGYMLGEHRCWAKNWMPLFEEISHTPFFIHDPRHPDADGTRRRALVQPAIDIGPTLLNFFGLDATPDMTGKNLEPVIASDANVREAAIFGYFGNRVNITDGKYAYYRAADPNQELHRYTLCPWTMRRPMGHRELAQAELSEPFSFTKGVRLLKLTAQTNNSNAPEQAEPNTHLLFDVEADPKQETPLRDEAVEARLCQQMAKLMKEADAPKEQFARMGVGGEGVGELGS